MNSAVTSNNNLRWHPDGTLPQKGEVFVFGSNLAGIHGAGAARAAFELFEAQYGCGKGWQPNAKSYAIPTKDNRIQTLGLAEIAVYVGDFVRLTQSPFVLNNGYWVTRVGCGLAGYQDHEIAPMFRGAQNCSFPVPWRPYLEV
jgi:hypothetical protein